jgi:hypothetical protein
LRAVANDGAAGGTPRAGLRAYVTESPGRLHLAVVADGSSLRPEALLERREATVRRLTRQIEALGGAVRVRSCLESGACVTVSVPPNR